MDEETISDLIADDYRDDPIAHETKWGEGWTRETWAEHFKSQGYLDEQ